MKKDWREFDFSADVRLNQPIGLGIAFLHRMQERAKALTSITDPVLLHDVERNKLTVVFQIHAPTARDAVAYSYEYLSHMLKNAGLVGQISSCTVAEINHEPELAVMEEHT